MLEYTGQFGLAGSLVGAILEACGIISLQNLIVQAEIYFRALGLLLFIVSVLIVFTKVATGGNLKQGLLLLLGPLLGLTALLTTVPVALDEKPSIGNVTLETGVLSFFGEAKDLKTLNLPLFVVIVNRVTNSISSQLSAFILSDKFRDMVVNSARDRLMSRILSAENIDASYRMLLTLSLSGDCAEMTSDDWELSRDKYKSAPPGSINAQLALQLKAKRDSLALKRHNLDKSILDYLTGLGQTPTPTPTCDEIWIYTRDASFKLADDMLDNSSIYRSEFPEITDIEWARILTDVKAKLSTTNNNAADLTEAYRILAAFILRNTFSNSANGVLSDSFAAHTDWKLERQDTGDWDLGSLQTNVNGIRTAVLRFAAAVPYVQGLCFYFLLVSYPFFCLLMIFPQKIGSLAIWASIWLWLCSWEIGFAIVSVVKDILWQFLPNIGDEVVGSDVVGTVSRLTNVNWDDPASMFTVLTAGSPEAHFQTYYGLIATLTLLVPVITGYCFQAASQFADILQRAWTPGGGRGK